MRLQKVRFALDMTVLKEQWVLWTRQNCGELLYFPARVEMKK
jgi:hypothetical protein